jgi:hypothetical protein
MQAVLAAGFRIEEYAMIRAILDSLNAPHIKVIICDDQILHLPQRDAVAAPEPAWEAPRVDESGGGGWGSQRAALFSGVSAAAQVRAPMRFRFV